MRGRKYTISALALAHVLCAVLLPVFAQETVDVSAPPSLHLGSALVVRPRAKIQVDLRSFRPELPGNTKVFQARRARFGVDGTLFRDIGYTVRVETSKGNPQFRDFFVKYQRLRSFQIQAGRFKIPLGLDQLTDSGELDFVQRSRIGSIVAPGRDTGVMVLGDVIENRIQYSAGLFRHDGRNSEIEEFAAAAQTLPGGNRTMAARLTFQPILPSVSMIMRNLQVGAAFTHSRLTSGLSSLPGVTVSNQVFFPRMYANGSRMRRAAELSASVGSLSLKGEIMDAREQRLQQGLDGGDLPALKTQGWYISAVQPLAGHLSNGNSGFLRSILPGKQLGLIEATARYEMIRFGSSAGGAAPSRNPRAANVLGNEERAWTAGLNWHASRYLKLQINGVHETLRDPARTPIDGQSQYWTLVNRMQLYF